MNVVVIIGRLAHDPELRYATDDKPVARFRLIVDRLHKKDAISGIDCEVWGKPAENLCKYKRQGDELGVSGELVNEPWQDKEGNKRQGYKIIASRIDWLRNKGGGQEQQSAPASQSAYAGWNDEDAF